MGFGSPPQGYVAAAISIAVLTAAGLFTTANTWTGSQTFSNGFNLNQGIINYTGHQIALPAHGGALNTVTVVLGNGTFNGTLGSTVSVTTLSRAGHTSTFPLTTGNLPQLNATQSFTGNNTVWLGSGGIKVRNPASTFGTTIDNAAIIANRTLLLPLLTQTETIAIQPQSNFTTGHNGGNSTGTGTTAVMLGNYATITPTVTGNIRIYASGYWDNSVVNDGCRADVRVKTSNMGVNGGALTGTLTGTNIKMIGTPASGNQTFAKIVASTGNVVGTKLFIDLAFNALTGGTCTIRNMDWLIQEY